MSLALIVDELARLNHLEQSRGYTRLRTLSPLSILLAATICNAQPALSAKIDGQADTYAVAKARKLAKEGKTKESRAFLSKYLSEHPNCPNALVELGLSDNGSADFKSCREHLAKALAITDGGKGIELVTPAYVVKAFANCKLENYKEAMQDIERARAISPTYSEVFHIRGEIFLRQGKKREAFADYQRAVELGGMSPEILKKSKRLSFEFGNSKLEKKYLDLLLAKAPEDFDAWMLAADWQSRNGNHKAAVKDVQKANSLRPNDYPIQFTMMRYMLDAGDYSGAEVVRKKLLTQKPNDLEPIKVVVGAMMADKKFQAAASLVEAEIAKHPSNPDLREMLANCYRRLGRSEDTITQFEKAAAIKQPDTTTLIAAAESYERMEEHEKALNLFLKASTQYKNPVLFVNIARCHLALKQYDKAAAALSKAIQGLERIDPQSRNLLAAYNLQARCELELKNYPKARELACKVLLRWKDDFTAHCTRAKANKHLRNYKEGIADLTFAISRHPDLPVLYQERADMHEAVNDKENASRDRQTSQKLTRTVESDLFPSKHKAPN